MLKLLDISEICYIIQSFNSYNLLTGKVTEKNPLSNLQTKRRKLYLEPSNINLASVFEHVRKRLLNLLTQRIQFTDQQIYLKKQQTFEKIISICEY